MIRKLKRHPVQSLLLYDSVPIPVLSLCRQIEACEIARPHCVDFSPDSLYVHKTIVEAVSNSYMLELQIEEDVLGVDVLLMVLRTYLRNFVEPIFTLHLSKVCKMLVTYQFLLFILSFVFFCFSGDDWNEQRFCENR
jgi:hypothetical protein